jgi:hypothetical protein
MLRSWFMQMLRTRPFLAVLTVPALSLAPVLAQQAGTTGNGNVSASNPCSPSTTTRAKSRA